MPPLSPHLGMGFGLGSILALFIFFLFCKKLVMARPRPTHENPRPLRSPPSPPWLPVLGHLHLLGSLPHRSLRALSDRYGPLMLLHLGHVPTLIVSSADAAEEVMKTHDHVFASRPVSSIANRLFYGSLDMAFAPYGEYWRHARRIAVLHLLSNKMVQSFRSVREEEVSLMVDKIIRDQAGGGQVNLSETLVSFTNNVICRAVFGKKYSSGHDFGGLLAEFVALLGEFPVGEFVPWLWWLDWLSGLDARVKRNSDSLNRFLDTVLQDHVDVNGDSFDEDDEESKCGNFVGILMSLGFRANEDTNSAGLSLSRDSIKGIILDMFAAGTDTTFTALEWTMTELVRHPEELKRLQEEVRSVARNPPKKILEEEDIDQMSNLKAVIKESLRLHSPVPLLVPRESMEDCELQGYHIPKGTRIMINAWAIGRDPRSWDNPDEFLPDRFINNSIDFKGNNFALIPFGAGRRGCPGIGFAASNVELAIANLLYCFDWELPEGIQPEKMDITEISGITTHRKSSLMILAKQRVDMY